MTRSIFSSRSCSILSTAIVGVIGTGFGVCAHAQPTDTMAVPGAQITNTQRIVRSSGSAAQPLSVSPSTANPDMPAYNSAATSVSPATTNAAFNAVGIPAAASTASAVAMPESTATPTYTAPTRSVVSTTARPTVSAIKDAAALNQQTQKVPATVLASGTDVNQLASIPAPSVRLADIDYLITKLVPRSQYGSEQFDVSLVDDFINQISRHARHYPTNFDNATQKYNAKQTLKTLEATLRAEAERADASFDILLRAAQLNGMGRNLDLGSDYAVRASNYLGRALVQQPNSIEANLLYGILLTEGGGFKEGRKYLDRAAAQNSIEAQQSLAQSDLMTENRSAAASRLQQLSIQYPNNALLKRQLQIVQAGDFYIWDLPGEAYADGYPVAK